jgi:hypothetical protein
MHSSRPAIHKAKGFVNDGEDDLGAFRKENKGYV